MRILILLGLIGTAIYLAVMGVARATDAGQAISAIASAACVIPLFIGILAFIVLCRTGLGGGTLGTWLMLRGINRSQNRTALEIQRRDQEYERQMYEQTMRDMGHPNYQQMPPHQTTDGNARPVRAVQQDQRPTDQSEWHYS